MPPEGAPSQDAAGWDKRRRRRRAVGQYEEAGPEPFRTAVDVVPGQMLRSRKGALMSTDAVPGWPRVEAVAHQDGTGEVTIDGTAIPIATTSLDEAVTTCLLYTSDAADE